MPSLLHCNALLAVDSEVKALVAAFTFSSLQCHWHLGKVTVAFGESDGSTWGKCNRHHPSLLTDERPVKISEWGIHLCIDYQQGVTTQK